MPFKIKDLMIHVLDPKAPAPRPCPGPSICTIPSLCRPLSHCLPITFCETLPTHICTAIYSLCGLPSHCGPTFCAIPTQCAGGTICPVAVSQCGAIVSHCGGTPTFCAIPSNCGIVLSQCGAATPCGALPSLCGPCSAGTVFDPTIVEGDPAAGLAALKEQLKQAVTNVETQEAALNESLLPQTVAEAEDLEKRLTAALEEVKARKAQLQKTPNK